MNVSHTVPNDAARTVLVTGGTDGIGHEIARLYAARGDRVIATGRHVPGGVPSSAPGSTPSAGRQAIEGVRYRAVDQSRPEEAAGIIAQACRAEGGADIAILCAGTGTLATGGVEGADAIRQTLRVNLEATILIAHALAPQLLERSGTLALIGSVARKGFADLPSYAASKGGLHGFARALGEEWRGRANVVMLHPGPTRTGMQDKAGLDVSRIAWAFLSPALVARMVVARIEAADGKHRPVLATLAHGAGLRHGLLERTGFGR